MSQKRTRSKSNYSRHQHNRRKNQTKKLNYKRLFFTIATLFITIYLFNAGISKITQKNKTPDIPALSQTIAQDTTISMSVVGDIMCHTTNFQDAYNKETKSYDFSPVFTDIADYLKDADICIGNLETTFAGKDVGYSGYPTFNTPEQLAQNLKDVGVDVVSTANNHSLDKRYDGLVSTLDELDKVGISHTGTYKSEDEQNSILIKDVNGIKIAFLSFTYGTNGIPVPKGKEYCINLIDKDFILTQLNKTKELSPDLICVSMHWGIEYKLKPNDEQKELADFLFKNGVDIIFGSHPHVLEPMEKRTLTLADGSKKNVFLIYSLGNFMSGQVAENTMNSIILQLKITKHPNNAVTIDSYSYIPIFMLDAGSAEQDRYKILDINKNISAYEVGNANSIITKEVYDKLKKSKEKIENTLAPEI